MKLLKIIVVGDQYIEFSDNQTIFTHKQFQHFVATESAASHLQNNYQIYLGQGLSDMTIELIRQKIMTHNLRGQFIFIGSMHYLKRAAGQIISDPEKISEHVFQCFLMLDEACIDNSMHIQSTSLIEAARQMARKVSENFFVSPQKKGQKSFVLNQLNFTFNEYIFPLDIEFIFKIEQLRHGLDGNFNAVAAIQVIQNMKVMMAVDMDFSVMEKNTLLDIERYMAACAVDTLINASNLRLVNQFAA